MVSRSCPPADGKLSHDNRHNSFLALECFHIVAVVVFFGNMQSTVDVSGFRKKPHNCCIEFKILMHADII